MTTSDIMATSLAELGYELETLQLGENGKPFFHITAPRGEGQLLISKESPLYPFATASARLICNHKLMAYDLATYAGVRIPDTVYIKKSDTQLQKVEQVLTRHGAVIVKPADSSLSNGLSLDITNLDAAKKAIEYARKYSESVIVQEQVVGDEIRFVVIDGNVRAAILRQTPRVVGDGKSTLATLIQNENKARSELKDTMVTYPQLNKDIIKIDMFNLQSIPNTSEVVELSKATMIRGGASIYDVIDDVDESYLKIVNGLGEKLGKGFVVVDMMLEDYKQPSNSRNYAFIEFNLTPALQLFYSCRDGKHFRVAEQYLAPMIDTIVRKEYL